MHLYVYICILLTCLYVCILLTYKQMIKFTIFGFHIKLRYSLDLKVKGGSLWGKMEYLDHETLDSQSDGTMKQKKFKEMD